MKSLISIAITMLLLLSACGKYGYHEAPACNKDFTVLSSGNNSNVVGLPPYWFEVEGSGKLESYENHTVGSTVCLYVE